METFKREIFEQLGNVFYAIAAEQHISPLASAGLKMVLRKDWLTEKDQRADGWVPEAAHWIGLTIDSLQSEKARPSDAYAAFENFYLMHGEQFSFALKQNVLETTATMLRLFPTPGKKNVYAENLKVLLHRSMQGTESR